MKDPYSAVLTYIDRLGAEKKRRTIGSKTSSGAAS
jgi:hypothetical protein